MSTDHLSGESPATLLFPQFESGLYRMAASEVAGLSDEQLDFESAKWGWSEWSIRRHLSHMASGDIRWFWQRWGRALFPGGLPPGLPSPEELDALSESKYDRRLDEDLYWDVAVILEKLRQGQALAHAILSNETAGSVRTKESERVDNGQWPSLYDAHPSRCMRRDSQDPTRAWLTLEFTFRHRYFEHITHLYNIQRIKLALGLTTAVEVPMEGYLALPGWDLSTP
jgi:hypothetical protein